MINNNDNKQAMKEMIAQMCLREEKDLYILVGFKPETLKCWYPGEEIDENKTYQIEDIQPGMNAMMDVEIIRVNGGWEKKDVQHWEFHNIKSVAFDGDILLISEGPNKHTPIDYEGGAFYTTIDISQEYLLAKAKQIVNDIVHDNEDRERER